jgi:uncharacterized protein
MNDFFRSMAGPTSGHPARAALVGTSFKHAHLGAILDEGLQDGFFEVHAENYMGAGGPPHRALAAIRERYPVSLHGVCMSLGGPHALNKAHLARFSDLVTRYKPAFVSEHLAWSSHGGHFFNDLLPLPYHRATLDRVCAHIDQMQNAIGRPILLENPSTYVMFASSTMSETGFLREVAQRTGCGLLLDVNNVFVSAINHGYSAREYLSAFALEYVGEIHLAGHSEQRDDENQPLLIDSHDRRVADSVWELYGEVIARIGATPTLIEWDSDLPAWNVLRAQAETARQIMTERAPTHDEDLCHAL